VKRDFTSLHYLQTGNAKQQAVYRLLTGHRVFLRLAAFHPVLAGTIPLEIDTSESDLDILCQVPDLHHFAALLRKEFGAYPQFELSDIQAQQGLPTLIGRFRLETFPVEIFGQNKPVTQQQAYRHLLIEYRILQERGEAFRRQIVALKQQGIKTEPAFAQLLGLPGNPYTALLEWK
jgi:hypothetical protein